MRPGDQLKIFNARALFNILLISYHSSHLCWSHLRQSHREADISHNPHNPEKPPNEVVSAHEDPKALYGAIYKPQTDGGKLLIMLHKTCLLFSRLAVETKTTKYARIHTLFNASSSSSEEESLCQTCQCNGKSERILSLEISGGEAVRISFPPLAAIFGLLSFLHNRWTQFATQLTQRTTGHPSWVNSFG